MIPKTPPKPKLELKKLDAKTLLHRIEMAHTAAKKLAAAATEREAVETMHDIEKWLSDGMSAVSDLRVALRELKKELQGPA